MSRQPRKMDAPRALGMLGFKSSRALDQGTEDERRHMLDKQLFIRMQEIAVSPFTSIIFGELYLYVMNMGY